MTEQETKEIWKRKYEAEIRSLYFGELASRYARYKQVISGVSFFFSSAAAASLIGKLDQRIPIVLSAIVAVLSAYSIATGLDRRVNTLGKLHAEWNALSTEYDRLWNHWSDEDSDRVLADLAKRGREASQLAATEAPYEPELMDKWQELVYRQSESAAAASLALGGETV